MTDTPRDPDPTTNGVETVLDAPEPLAAFNHAGLLGPADIHVAVRLGRLTKDERPTVALATALTVRAIRHGHVCVDLSRVREDLAGPGEYGDAGGAGRGVAAGELPWPEPDAWLSDLTASPQIAVGDDVAPSRPFPLRLVGTSLYLDRYWRDEVAVADELRRRAGLSPTALSPDEVALAGRLFPDDAGPDGPPGAETSTIDAPDGRDARGAPDGRSAALSAVSRALTVVAGGPGTGKTTAIGRILGLLAATAAADGSTRVRFPLVGLAAPTGKAAARLTEAVRAEADRLPLDETVRAFVRSAAASTIHRLLGATWGTGSRFRHDRNHRLPHDVVIVDETSMVSLSLMARLLEAMRPDARLILVGDPDQLASVEAGAVLGDIVGPAASAEHDHPSPMRSSIALLRRNYRFGDDIARLAAAIQAGNVDATLSALGAARERVEWFPTDEGRTDIPADVKARLVSAAGAMVDAARQGRDDDALGAQARSRVLCAHRRGPDGVAVWNARLEAWLGVSPDPGRAGEAGHGGYAGRPVLVGENDYALRLFNGDTGVLVRRPDGSLEAVLAAEAGTVRISPSRLPPAETVFAMTVHKSQGSQFGEVLVVLPAASSAILTRELLYTAVTRAQERLTILGSYEALVTAVQRPVARASGLTARLW